MKARREAIIAARRRREAAGRRALLEVDAQWQAAQAEKVALEREMACQQAALAAEMRRDLSGDGSGRVPVKAFLQQAQHMAALRARRMALMSDAEKLDERVTRLGEQVALARAAWLQQQRRCEQLEALPLARFGEVTLDQETNDGDGLA